MWSCAAAAIVVAAGTSARQAKAQAFQGTPVAPGPNIASDGSAARTITSPTTETITVATPKATINWTPFDNDGSGTIDFLPAGNIATFTNDPLATADFTVLNRIVPFDPSRPIALNGSVISQLQSISGTSTGGHVWFYSPGGIVVGATAVFNVGGLLLTVNDPLTFSATTNGFTGNFAAAANSTSAVTIAQGAQINATPENSYVAVVAPRVVQDGTVNVNGAAAYVAGEDVTLTMNQGLFDIAVNVGTGDANGVVHTGTTGGPSSTGAGDNHRIYMVAVPKNQALTMLLSGNAGFQPAASASVVNGQIVLGAGSSVAETSGTLAITSPNIIDADLTIGSGNYTSDVRAFARGDIYASADDGSISFSRDVSLTSLLAGATGTITVGATNGHTLSIGRNLQMQTSGATFSSGAPEEANIIADGGTVNITGNATVLVGAASDGTPGDAVISASDNSENGGAISIGGETVVSTSAAASSAIPNGDSADSFAGNITVEAFDGGTITLHNTLLFASANGQDSGDNGSGFAGDAFGGNVNVTANGGDISIDGNLFATVDGIGGNMLDGGLFGGGGFGGSIDMSVFDGSIGVTGNVFLSALGLGGDYTGEGISSSAQGGFGRGGSATIFSGGPGSITISGATTLRSDGTGGDAQTGGVGVGGRAGISGVDGTIALGSTINVSARGTGGDANIGFGGDGGDGFGGHAVISANAIPPGVEQFASAASITGGNATIDATGTGGDGGDGNGDNFTAGSGGAGVGGTQDFESESNGGAFALAQVDGANLSLSNVTLLAQGFGGAGGTGGTDQAGGQGGSGLGGTTQAGLFDDPFSPTGATTGSASYGDVFLFASGNGGSGGNGPAGQGDGGSATGGFASLWSNAGVTATSLTFFANANGGDGGNGGTATGGISSIQVVDLGLLDVEVDVVIEAAAASGDGSSGTTGDATGGTAEMVADGGDITVGGALEVYANGDAEEGVTGGTGTGGFARVDARNGGSIAAGSILAQATGEGGNATGQGGDGIGGTADVRAQGDSSITAGDVTADASAVGGNGQDGGTGTGGDVEVNAQDAGGLLTITGLATLDASGTGGNGTAAGTGGHGQGGSATLNGGIGESGNIGGTTMVQDALVQANGTGGTGGIGGSGNGGDAQVGTRNGTFTVAGTLTGQAIGTGGSGLNGAGGTGTGGYVLLAANFADDTGIGTTTIGDGDLSAAGIGGNGGGSGAPGGDGIGGLVEVWAQTGGSVLTADTLFIHARGAGGTGGNGAVGGRGGDGNGGHTDIDIGAGTASLGDVHSNAMGFGGKGGNGSSGAGGNGGDGFGGSTELTVTGNLTGTSFTSFARAFGGDGGLGTVRGAGGAGQAGTALFDIFSAGQADFTGAVIVNASAFGGEGASGGNAVGGLTDIFIAGTLAAGEIQDTADGFGGVGTAGSGGDGLGGSSFLSIGGGNLTVTGDSIVLNQGIGGDGTTAGGGGFGGLSRVSGWNGAVANFGTSLVLQADAAGGLATAGTGGASEAGQAQLFATDSDLSGSDVTLSATADIGGSVEVELAGSTLTTDSLTLNSDGTDTAGTVSLGLHSDFEGTTSSLDTGAFTVTADGATAGDIFVTIANGSVANFGVAQLSAVGSIGTGSINIDLGGASIIVLDGGPVGALALDNTALTAQSLSLITSGDINVSSLNGASIDVAGLFEADAGGALTLDDNDEDAVIQADVINWAANTVTNNFDLLARVIGIAADLDLDAGDLTAGETITLSAGGDLLSGQLGAGQAITLTADNNVVTGNLDSGQTVAVDAGNNSTVGIVDAGNSATFTAGRVASFLGLVTAPTITVTSADINIIGQLGEHGLTDLVTLNAVSDGEPILIGDDAGPLSEGLQYRLTNDEDIHSDSVVFNVVNASEGPTPDVVLAGLEMEGSLTDGGGASHVELNTDGSAFVDGLVLYSNATATDLLAINADAIQVNTSTGGRIAIVDSSEERPSGILELNADNIWVGDETLLDNLNANPNFVGRDDMVGTNSGPEVPEGYLIAGGMTLSVGETLFVQNSGGATGLAGITVGDGGLEIRITGEAPAEVVAYGRKFNADGSFTTGDAFFDLVDFTFEEGSAYTDLSEFNECLINTGCGVVGGAPFGQGPESILGPVGEMSDPEQTIDNAIEDADGGSDDISSDLIDTSGLSGDDLIDEGVTSGGDNNQWVDPNCRPGETDDLCPVDDGNTKQEPAQ